MESFFSQNTRAQTKKDPDRGTLGEVRIVRADVSGAGDPREVLLRNGALELLHERRRPWSSHLEHEAGEHQRKGPVQVQA